MLYQQNSTTEKQFETVEEHLAYYMGKCEVLEMIIHSRAGYPVIAPPPVIYPPLQTPPMPIFNTGNNGNDVNPNQTNEINEDSNERCNIRPDSLKYHVVLYTRDESRRDLNTLFDKGVKLISTLTEGKDLQPHVNCKYVQGPRVKAALDLLARGPISQQSLEFVADNFIGGIVLNPLFATNTITKNVSIVSDTNNDVLDKNLLKIMEYIENKYNVTTKRTIHTNDDDNVYVIYTFINLCK